MPIPRRLLLPALGGAALVCLYFAATGYFTAADLLTRGVETTGRVVEDVGGKTVLNRLAFTTEDGREITTTSQVHGIDAPRPGAGSGSAIQP